MGDTNYEEKGEFWGEIKDVLLEAGSAITITQLTTRIRKRGNVGSPAWTTVSNALKNKFSDVVTITDIDYGDKKLKLVETNKEKLKKFNIHFIDK